MGMATANSKLTEGDTFGLTGEVTMVHDDGTVTISLHGYVYPLTLRGEHLSLIAKSKGRSGQIGLQVSSTLFLDRDAKGAYWPDCATA